MAWSSDSQHIVTAAHDGKLLIWHAFTGKKRLAIPLRTSHIVACDFSSSSSYVASGGLDNLCSIFSIAEMGRSWEIHKPTCELPRHEGYVSSVEFVDQNNRILTASGDGTAILWDIEKATHITQFVKHRGDLMSVSVSPTSINEFITASIDAQVMLWDVRQGNECVAAFSGHESDINHVAWFPDGKSFVSGSDDCTCRLYDVSSYCQLAKYDLASKDIVAIITRLGVSKSGRYSAVQMLRDLYRS